MTRSNALIHPLRGAVLAATLAVTGCATTGPVAPDTTLADFRDCRAEVLALDSAAGHDGGNAAQYARAGHLAEQCLVAAEGELDTLGAEAMQLHALSVLNLLRGGEVEAARGQLAAFSWRFPGKDLRGDGQTSVLESLALVLGVETDRTRMNIARPLSAELARIEHWQQN